MCRFLVSILLVLCVALPSWGTEKQDRVWQHYREIELPGASMEQIMAGVEAWDAAKGYDYAFRVDTADYDNGFANIEGVCTFEYNPKGYWCQGLPKGRTCHALVTMTARDGVLKVWFTRFSFGDTADGLFHECNGLSYNSGPICVDLPHSLKGIDRFGARLLYKHVKPHMLKWVETTMQELADYVAEQQSAEGF